MHAFYLERLSRFRFRPGSLSCLHLLLLLGVALLQLLCLLLMFLFDLLLLLGVEVGGALIFLLLALLELLVFLILFRGKLVLLLLIRSEERRVGKECRP